MNLVILDRDGVINQDSDEFIKSADEWLPIPGSLEAIADRAGRQPNGNRGATGLPLAPTRLMTNRTHCLPHLGNHDCPHKG